MQRSHIVHSTQYCPMATEKSSNGDFQWQNKQDIISINTLQYFFSSFFSGPGKNVIISTSLPQMQEDKKIDQENIFYIYIYMSICFINKIIPLIFSCEVAAAREGAVLGFTWHLLWRFNNTSSSSAQGLSRVRLVQRGDAEGSGAQRRAVCPRQMPLEGGREGSGGDGGVRHQMTGADRSLVTVGRSLTVANGFPPLETVKSSVIEWQEQRVTNVLIHKYCI